MEEKAFRGTSRKRLSHQMERFLSVADKLYPAWQVSCALETGVSLESNAMHVAVQKLPRKAKQTVFCRGLCLPSQNLIHAPIIQR